MLREESIDQINQLSGFAKPREKKVFFELLVIVLDEVTDNVGGAGQYRAVKRLFGAKTAEMFIVNEQDPVEQAVFAHEVFRWRNVFAGLFFRFRSLLRNGKSKGWDQNPRTGCGSALKELTAAGTRIKHDQLLDRKSTRLNSSHVRI